MTFGYNGKIIRVDLTHRTISVEERDDFFYRTYMGGACVGAYYLLKEMPSKADPFGPDNIIVFAPSAVTGALAPGFSRFAVIAKSPLTELIGDSQAGGYWGPELKFAGFDAVVIKGKADKPVYLWIQDGKAEIKDAAHLWGKTTGEVEEIIRQELGDNRIRVAQIGPAGEKLVRFANITNNLNHFNGRTGMGAVMGSKKLKAIAVRGHNRLKVKDTEKIKELAKYFGRHFMENPDVKGLHTLGTSQYTRTLNVEGHLPTKNFQTGYFEGAEDISAETLHETIFVGKEGCFACPIRCKRVVKADEPYKIDPTYGGPEYEGIAAFGSNCGVSDIRAIAKANEICSKYGMDSISTGATIAFAMECYENDIISDEDTNGLKLNFGNAEALVTLVKWIAQRKGIGNILAEGVMRAAQKLGIAADKYALHCRGQELPMHDPRVKGMLGISYAVSPIGADHVVVEHDTDFDFRAPEIFLERVKSLGLLERLETTSIKDEKIRMFYYLQQHFSFMDTLTICVFCFAPVRFYTMNQLVELVSAITGWETSLWEIMKYGERRINMFRAFNIREESPLDVFWLPERMFEPIQTGPRKGAKVLPEAFKESIRKYFEIMNWDEDGIPREMKLVELNLGWINPMIAQYRIQ